MQEAAISRTVNTLRDYRALLDTLQSHPGALIFGEDVARKGYVLVGDVHAPSVREVAGALTPVPGGVGPLTIALLMKNTVKAAGVRES